MRNLRPVTGVSMLILFSLLLAGTALGDEVRPGIQILHGINVNLPNDDLKPLKRIIGDASVVALGESVHTSGGYYRLKYRVFRYLVEEMGFRAFAIESPWDTAERAAEYVQTCDGTAEDGISGLFYVWRSESVRDLVTWMCLWNRAHPFDRVYFYGFDMQQPDEDYPALKAYLERVGRGPDDPRIQGLERCSTTIYDDIIEEDDYRECVKRLDQLAAFFDRREENLVRFTSREEFEWAQIRMVGFRAWQDELYYMYTPDYWLSILARDEAMAYVFAAIRDLRFPGIKTVIWAHNTHIAKNSGTFYGVPTMGTFLAEALGDDYVNFGLIAWDVHLDWGRFSCGKRNYDYPDDSVEELLHAFGERHLLVDLDYRGSDRQFFEPGQNYQVGSYYYMVPRQQFNGFFFLNHSPRMKPVGREPCM